MRKKRKIKDKNSKKYVLKKRIYDSMDIPFELIDGIMRITLYDNSKLYIESHKGIIEYTNDSVRLNTDISILAIKGDNLVLDELSMEKVIVSGKINSIEFVY